MNSSFLPGCAVHVGQKRARVGEPLPLVARHLVEQRPLAVHHFVVRNRQHEILGERIQQAERDVVVVVLAVDRILLEVVQHVVHPAHVPLHGEAQPVQVDRPRDAGERGGFLGDGDRARAPVCASSLKRRRKSIASRFSLPP